jgi:hypothetical protein
MATGGKDSTVRLWQIPSIPTPVPGWFLALTETVAGVRLGDRGQVEFVSSGAFEAALDDLKARDKTEFYARLAQWFLADPSNRAPNPF